MAELKVKSVALTASDVEDIIIREKDNSKVIFRPKLVENNDDHDACVKGAIIYQKKNDDGKYSEDKNIFDLRKVKKGECAKFELSSEEILTLLQKWDMLKGLYKKYGLNFGETSYYITEGNLGEVLEQISHFEDKGKLLEALKNLKNIDIDKLSLIVSISKIDNILKDWEENKDNSSEGFWQEKFKENSWVLSQIFACPYVYIGSTPYAGGQSINNTGGVKSDILMKQLNSDNIAFIEIKTPMTNLLNKCLYRGRNDEEQNAVYSLSEDLSGGINQVFNQKRVFMETKRVSYGKERDYGNPKCVLIIGKRLNLSSGQVSNFDTFRHNSPNIEIITFDELFKRVKLMREVFVSEQPNN
jgi:hypothetical protein